MSSLIPRLDTLEIACSRGGVCVLSWLEAGAIVIRAGVVGWITNACSNCSSRVVVAWYFCSRVAERALLRLCGPAAITLGAWRLDLRVYTFHPFLVLSRRRCLQDGSSRLSNPLPGGWFMQIKNIANARRINNRCVSPICGCSCDIAACLTMSCPLCTSLVNFLWKEERHAVIPTVGSYDIDSSIGPFSQVMDSFPRDTLVDRQLLSIRRCF